MVIMQIETIEKSMDIWDFLDKSSFDTNSAKGGQFILYKITNMINGKVYIGKTKNIIRRAHDYVSEYSHKTGKRRSVWRAMQEYGIDSFKMTILDVVDDKYSAAEKELNYIETYNSYDPDVGYNTSMQSVINQKLHVNYKVRHQTHIERMRRSKIIAAVNIETHEIIYSTGLKLFGDYIGRGKDEVKSAAKRASTLEGYFLVYLDGEILRSQIQYAVKYIHTSRVKVNYHNFFIAVNMAYDALVKWNALYKEKLLVQSDTKLGYEFIDASVMKSYYKSLIENKQIKSIYYIID